MGIGDRRRGRESTARRPGRTGRAGHRSGTRATASGSASASSTPSVELSSSTAPIASMRGESLATREPSPRPVVPASPVRVTILERRWPMVGSVTRSGSVSKPPRQRANVQTRAPADASDASGTRPRSTVMTQNPSTNATSTATPPNYAPLTPLSLIARTAVHLAASSSRWSTASAATRGRRPTRARAGSRRRWRRPGSASATRSPRCSPTRRR